MSLSWDYREIKTKVPSQAYKDNWDKIFGKKDKVDGNLHQQSETDSGTADSSTEQRKSDN